MAAGLVFLLRPVFSAGKIAPASCLRLYFKYYADELRRIPENNTVALGENGTFICDGSTRLSTIWKVEKEGYATKCLNTRLAVDDAETVNNLKNERNIFLSRVMLSQDRYVSMIIITGTTENNITEVGCALERPDFSELNYSRAFLRVIGKRFQQCKKCS